MIRLQNRLELTDILAIVIIGVTAAIVVINLALLADGALGEQFATTGRVRAMRYDPQKASYDSEGILETEPEQFNIEIAIDGVSRWYQVDYFLYESVRIGDEVNLKCSEGKRFHVTLCTPQRPR